MQLLLKNIFYKQNDEDVYEWMLFISVCIFIISLATSRWVLSVAQIMMSGFFLLSGNYAAKIKRFWNNKAAVSLSSIILLYFVGMLWSEDLSFGFGRVLQNKLPFLSVILLFAAYKPFSSYRVHFIPILFTLSLLFTAFYGIGLYLTNPYIDPRLMSPFFPHIHLSIMMVFMAFFLPWHIKQITNNKTYYYLSIGISVFFGLYIFFMSSLNGILCLFLSLAYLIIREIFFKNPNRKLQIFAIFIALAGLGIGSWTLYTISQPIFATHTYTKEELKEKTALGNPYQHLKNEDLRENGHLVFYFIAEEEIRDAWNKRSPIQFDDKDNKGHEIKYTIYRYLSSKGLHKDAEGVNTLKEEEIRAIENGVPNYLYTQWPNIFTRLHTSVWELQEYKRTGDPAGKSLSQRLEIWSASWQAIQKHPILGWGTGDVRIAMHYGLDKIDSPYDSRMRHPHNQYLATMLSIGVVGLALMVLLIVVFVVKSKVLRYLPFQILLLILLVSSTIDSSFQSQMSLTFFLFFFSYFSEIWPQKTH